MADLPKPGKTTRHEVWWGGTEFRYREATDEDDAKDIADEFATEGHPNIQIQVITSTRKVLDYEPVALPDQP